MNTSTHTTSYPNSFLTIQNKFGRKVSDLVFNSLNRGQSILTTEDQLDQFLFSFGKMHHAKFSAALNALFSLEDINSNTKFEIFDYGCGQGLATIILLNELETRKVPVENIQRLTLIEPSKIALSRACKLLNSCSEIVAVNKTLDQLEAHELQGSPDVVTLHLFSNIIDMGDKHFSLASLANKINLSQSGLNYFVCASPLNETMFMRFKNEISSSHIIDYVKGTIGKWSHIHLIFKKDFV